MSTISQLRKERIKRIRDTFIMIAWIAARQFSHELQAFGLTLPQFVSLVALVSHQRPCTMSELTKATLQDPPTMTGITDRLVKMKLVQRTRSDTDRRVVLVQATQQGIDLIKRIRDEALDDVMNDYASLADSDQLADLDQLLGTFEQSLGYVLRVHLKRRHALDSADLEAEIERIQCFLRAPFCESETEANRPAAAS